MKSYTKQNIAEMTEILLNTFGDEVWDDGVEKTAKRWLRAMHEFAPEPTLTFKLTTFEAKVNQMIVVNNIKFSSLCAHHLFPFTGRVHVGYLPNVLQVGLSKIPRLVHHYATRPQVQEQLTSQIATHLKKALSAQGVAVVIEAQHTCMSARGVREHDGIMVTSEMRGSFLTSAEARTEFLRLAGVE